MALKHVFFILVLTCLIMANIANAISRNDRLNNNMKPGYDLAIRLEASGGLTELLLALTSTTLLISSPVASRLAS
ncbi:hypothetical protein CUMW_175230 [Citrus unshiu]|uniref:Uncharacterized protein n=1 Tax=Citrus unshiu TaxID=55188 RepID=A0A2H5PX14_CITUN|nr:hypothetical protein CUMW_175230 [Citrus unshiu]